MGLFDFFKKKPVQVKAPVQTEPTQIEVHTYLIEQLQKKLENKGCVVERSTQYLALLVNGELEITTAVMEGSYHSLLIHMLVYTIHKDYFPQGIEASLAGMGQSMEDKVASAIDNYLDTIFPPIIASLTECPQAEKGFTSQMHGRQIRWFPHLGEMVYQGPWTTVVPDNFLYLLLREKMKDQLPDQKINWLKVYLSRLPGGEIVGECLLNNEVWEEGFAALSEFAEVWEKKGEFLAQKQFMMFRQADEKG